MKLYPFVGILLVALCIGAVVSQDLDKDETNSLAPKAKVYSRDSVETPKLFDFNYFKTIFNKKYSSLVEELARGKLFLARAFRAFLSFIKFKHYKSTMFLKVHEMSDYTMEEVNALAGRRSLDDFEDSERSDLADNFDEAVDFEDIQIELRRIEVHKDKPGFAEILQELNGNRHKRDTNLRAEATIDDLVGRPEQPEESDKTVSSVPSNNPDYEMPELSSYGDKDDNEEAPMSEWISDAIVNFSGMELVNSMVKGAIDTFNGDETNGVDPNLKPKFDLPDEMFTDHRESKCFTPISNQKKCGSCYIFSTVALYEYTYCKETGKSISFSQQYPLDCGGLIGLKGCTSGHEINVGRFFNSYGIELLKNYPYRHVQDTCPYNNGTNPLKMGYLRVKEGLSRIHKDEFNKAIKRVPIIRGVSVSKEFHEYGGGVDLGESCNRKRGHSMLIVGEGRQDGIDYWLFRNSYNPSWGENGHYKIAKAASHCFLDEGFGFVLVPRKSNTDKRVFELDKNPLNSGREVRAKMSQYGASLDGFLAKYRTTLKPATNLDVATPAD